MSEAFFENIYESENLLYQYLLFHYGDPNDLMPWEDGPVNALNFPARCVSENIDADAVPEGARALDVGCAVGRASFELARYCDDVTGIDFSHSFITAARALWRDRALPYLIKETGLITRSAVARVPDVEAPNVRFEQGDAQDLRTDLGSFDVVLAANLLCRLPRPHLFLQRLPELVKQSGQLIITTPNTWLSEFTAVDYWIGATPETGEPLEALQSALAPDFELVSTRDMPFVIREHKRKYQWSVAQASVWRRN